jgi:hypothetical protein
LATLPPHTHCKLLLLKKIAKVAIVGYTRAHEREYAPAMAGEICAAMAGEICEVIDIYSCGKIVDGLRLFDVAE